MGNGVYRHPDARESIREIHVAGRPEATLLNALCAGAAVPKEWEVNQILVTTSYIPPTKRGDWPLLVVGGYEVAFTPFTEAQMQYRHRARHEDFEKRPPVADPLQYYDNGRRTWQLHNAFIRRVRARQTRPVDLTQDLDE